MCACLFDLYYIAKRNSVTHLQVSLMLKIVNRFVRSSDRPQILAKLMKELPCLEPKIVSAFILYFIINPYNIVQ